MNAETLVYLACLTPVGIINCRPVVGVVSAPRIAKAYGVKVASPEIELLLRHRALLFGVALLRAAVVLHLRNS